MPFNPPPRPGPFSPPFSWGVRASLVLLALLAARERLLRDISHELRSPLARMEMAIGLARQDPASTPAQLARVQRESERLDELIEHILE